jgi:hypothetical protein
MTMRMLGWVVVGGIWSIWCLYGHWVRGDAATGLEDDGG